MKKFLSSNDKFSIGNRTQLETILGKRWYIEPFFGCNSQFPTWRLKSKNLEDRRHIALTMFNPQALMNWKHLNDGQRQAEIARLIPLLESAADGATVDFLSPNQALFPINSKT